jgi:parallel beta-helix repeat protein
VFITRKALALLLISAFLITGVALTAIELISPVKANAIPPPERLATEHGYIRSNGTVDPPTLPIQRDGNIYRLTDNILNYTFEVERDNVVIDGNGFLLSLLAYGEKGKDGQTKSAYSLILISNKSDIIVKNVTFNMYSTAISIRDSSNIVIFQNTIRNGSTGIYILRSVNCSIIDNKLIENSNTGLSIRDSAFLNIAYNTISKNNFHGGQISNLSYSNISRNDIIENYNLGSPGLGLYLTGLIRNNCIFENNFMNNDVGLDFTCFENSSDNLVYNNYWSNYRHQIFNYRGYVDSSVDSSPLSSPISTVFDSSVFTLPSFPTPEPEPEPFPIIPVAAAFVIALIVIAGLLVYFKKHKHEARQT